MFNLAMVLTQDTELPSLDELCQAYAELGGEGAQLKRETMEVQDGEEDGRVLSFQDSHGGNYLVVPTAGAVPENEADLSAEYSLAALGSDWTLEPHTAHFVVSSHGTEGEVADHVEHLLRFTLVLAAMARAKGAVGVYWGDAGATHPTDFFIDWAGGETLPIPLWSGVSLRGAENERVSMLSRGGEVLGVPDLMIVAPEDDAADALGFLFELLEITTHEGGGTADGEVIVGRKDDEQFVVKHVPSPVADDELVQFIEL